MMRWANEGTRMTSGSLEPSTSIGAAPDVERLMRRLAVLVGPYRLSWCVDRLGVADPGNNRVVIWGEVA
jgi:hypothetical protein